MTIDTYIEEVLEQPVATFSSKEDKIAVVTMNDTIELIWPFLKQGLQERLEHALQKHRREVLDEVLRAFEIEFTPENGVYYKKNWREAILVLRAIITTLKEEPPHKV